jgi:hypothetical protein
MGAAHYSAMLNMSAALRPGRASQQAMDVTREVCDDAAIGLLFFNDARF